ncbi:Lymphocyte-specific helicase [Dufourea novaeangliae]|uniref:Lymphocyte-specific helicase n=1 Tax=Dufourea novaeangliae TaxID=178035 RepID=A0A154PRT4_DUFNO|nr:Lymphocyte-specific helicase [Dufourea novaeangliae]
METKNESVNINTSTSRGVVSSNSIVKDVKFNNEPLKEEIPQKKRKRTEAEIEANRLAEKQYNDELQEQQYKRLMHLLNKSKFFSSYIMKKINSNMEKKDDNEVKAGRLKKNDNGDENTQPKEKKKKSENIRNYISKDVQKKIHTNKNKMNLSEENIEAMLIDDSQNEIENDSTSEIPKYFNGVLRGYQKQGLQWLKVLYENGINGILADEMGLGKTIQVIALLCHLFEKQQDGPYLIIAPLSTIPNWMLEFDKFAPNIPVMLLYGPENERLAAQREIKKKHKITNNYGTQPVVLTTFEIPILEKRFLGSQQWRVLKYCKSMNRLLLTGTPLQNNLAELWSLLNFLLPEIFDDLAVFESWIDVKELQYDEGTEKVLKQEQEKQVLSSLREILQPFMLRREKADVCLDIPPKKQLVVYAPLTELQHDLYKAVLNRDLQALCKINEQPSIYTEDGKRKQRRCVLKNVTNNNYNTSDSFIEENSSYSPLQENDESLDTHSKKQIKSSDYKNLSMWKQYTNVTERNQDFLINIKFNNRAGMYKKIVNHPYLVHCPLDPCGLPLVNEDLVNSSGKLLVLDAMLAKLKSQGHKVLLFSTMVTILNMIEDYLSMRTYEYVRLDGGTKLEIRKENIQAFNTNPNIFLFLVSTRAGGVGLNLVSADTVIIYDSDWNPQMDIQAMARCHRIGQTKPVVIYRLCTKGTIDETIINRAEAKRVLEKMVIGKQTGTGNLNSKETLLELQRLLESKECQVVASEKEEEELNKLLDRSDLYANFKPEKP